jgi:hypothetical protein
VFAQHPMGNHQVSARCSLLQLSVEVVNRASPITSLEKGGSYLPDGVTADDAGSVATISAVSGSHLP